MIPLRDNIPSEKPPIVTTAIIVVNVLVYAYQVLSGSGQELWAWKFGLIPMEFTQGIELTPQLSAPVSLNMFTSMFLHGGFLHLAGNMLYLWIFGDNVEDRLGHARFLAFYIITGIAATLLFVWSSPALEVPLVGASGAIAGVLGAYIISFPKARIATLIIFGFFIRVVQIPALIVLGMWFLIQVINGLPTAGPEQSGGVAFLAHVGGFVAGIILVFPFSPRGWRPQRPISDL